MVLMVRVMVGNLEQLGWGLRSVQTCSFVFISKIFWRFAAPFKSLYGSIITDERGKDRHERARWRLPPI